MRLHRIILNNRPGLTPKQATVSTSAGFHKSCHHSTCIFPPKKSLRMVVQYMYILSLARKAQHALIGKLSEGPLQLTLDNIYIYMSGSWKPCTNLHVETAHCRKVPNTCLVDEYFCMAGPSTNPDTDSCRISISF